MNRSSRDDSSIAMAMTNGLGSPPIYDQHFQQQPEQRQFASDYFGSMIKARSNENNVNGAAQVVGQMREESSDVGNAAQRLSSALPAANNIPNDSPQLEKKEIPAVQDDCVREEPDEIPCLMPFISVESMEDMIDPLMMDTDELNDCASKVCHNGDGSAADENDETSSVEFVLQENAAADVACSVDVEIDERPDLPSRFRCNECQHSFVTEYELELHTETLDAALLCSQCESSLWSPCALNRHKSEHAVAALQQQMAYTTSDYQVDRGRGSFADKRHACKYCGAGYTTKFNLMRHVRKNVIWLKDGERYKCDLCDATFLARCLLPIHKQEKHADSTELLPQFQMENYVEACLEPEAESVIVTPQFDLLGECDPLGESRPLPANSYHTFRTATATGISYNCKWCPERVPSHSALIKHISEEHPDVELFRCEPCNKTFLNKAGLYGHLTHHRFQCELCDLNFSSEDYLRQHRYIHGVEPAPRPPATAPAKAPPTTAAPTRTKFTKCDGIPYFELLIRVQHMEKPFECEFCGRKFTSKTFFLEHYLNHTGERPFRCSVCGQGFIRERAMEVHERAHGVPIQRTVVRPVVEPVAMLSTIPILRKVTEFTIINGRRQTARKSTSSLGRPFRIKPINRVVINSALFDPDLDITPEDREAFHFLPNLNVKMADVSSLEDHAYVCPYCDKFFPRATSLCGHKKICSYLTRKRAHKELGLPMPEVPRKWAPRIANVSTVGAPATARPAAAAPKFNATAAAARAAAGAPMMRPDEPNSVVIANMRHHIVFEGGERVFVCGVCGKRFARKFTLSEHVRSHTTDRPFHCDRCPRVFKRKSSLFRHRQRSHVKGGVVSGYGAGGSSAQHPMADQNWMSFEPQCNVKIEFSDEDEDDEEDDDEEDEDTAGEDDDYKPFIDYNDGEYPAEQDDSRYDYSEMSVFEPQCIVKDEDASDDDENSNSNSNCPYPAATAVDDDDNELVDTSMNHFLEVGLTNNGDASPGVGGGDDDDDEEDVEDEEPENGAEDATWAELEYERAEQQAAAAHRFLCGECNRRFPRREDLRRHFGEHNPVGPFKCFYCEKTFDRRKYLSKHVRNHAKKKSYQCSYCERAYVTNAELTVHVRIHTGERPYECDRCGRGFRVQKQLTLHYRTHTGEKPYACARCPSTFSRHETLFRHNRVCQAKTSAAHAATPQLSQLLRQPPPPPLTPRPSSLPCEAPETSSP